MTLNGVTAPILRFFAHFDFFAGQIVLTLADFNRFELVVFLTV